LRLTRGAVEGYGWITRNIQVASQDFKAPEENLSCRSCEK
jgi:hypothetical protein